MRTYLKLFINQNKTKTIRLLRKGILLATFQVVLEPLITEMGEAVTLSDPDPWLFKEGFAHSGILWSEWKTLNQLPLFTDLEF